MAVARNTHDTLGQHILLDVWDVDFDRLNDVHEMARTLRMAAHKCGATVVDASFHRFPIQGLSGVLVLAESHISVHTFPEHGYASFDIFTCGSQVDPAVACGYIVDQLQAGRHFSRYFVRGDSDGIVESEPLSLHHAG